MNDATHDPLAHASETPNVAALIQEFQDAQQSGPCLPGRIGGAEGVRYNGWAGKSNPPDGCRWQRNAPQGVTVRPFDGCPDTDVQLTDEICEAEIDLDLMAHQMAVLGSASVHTSPLTAAQRAELLAMSRWVQQVIQEDLQDDEELLAQIKAQLGWAVLNPGWLERYELVERTMDLEEALAPVFQTAGPEAARALYTAILDPTLEDQAVMAMGGLLGELPKARVKQVVRDLREHGTATFLDRQLVEKRPTIRTLIPGYNYFVSGATGKIEKARGHLVVERFFQADLEATAADAGWNPEFVEAVKATAGQYSSYSEAMRDKARVTEQGAEDYSIELWTTYVKQFDPETGAAGIYCTTFSPHLEPIRDNDGNPKRFYAHHYLLAYAHGKAPFIEARREVNGPAMDDSRGVPDITRSNQKIIKSLQDAGVLRALLEVDPPRALLGAGWSKTPDKINIPGAVISAGAMGFNSDVKDLSPSKGNPQFAEAAIERIERTTHRQFALPDVEVHPARWQPRQMRRTRRTLSAWREAYWQLVVLCYQELEIEELAQVIGRWPQLKVEDLLRYRITLTFDARAMDNDWRKDTLQTMVQLLQIDKGGLIDTGLLIQLIGSMTDPTLMDTIVRDPAGASAALYRKVQNDINDIMLGNPPPLVEMDATAGMQLKMAFQVIGQNERYQKVISQDQQIQENLKTYVQNLQHSEQETQISPMQGRLGVAAMPQRPVQKGPAQLGE